MSDFSMASWSDKRGYDGLRLNTEISFEHQDTWPTIRGVTPGLAFSTRVCQEATAIRGGFLDDLLGQEDLDFATCQYVGTALVEISNPRFWVNRRNATLKAVCERVLGVDNPFRGA